MKARVTLRTIRFMIPGIAAFLFGCSPDGAYPDSPCIFQSAQLTIVVTFDDGPIAADIVDPAMNCDNPVLLTPLTTILHKLDTLDIPAVFYVKGPGSVGPSNALFSAYGHGIRAIYEAGHIIGYHAFQHDRQIWIAPFEPAFSRYLQMSQDLDRLESYMHDAAIGEGLIATDVFTPIFRQPYGGAWLARGPAAFAASRNGWTYRGYRIDSGDWFANADVNPSFNTDPISSDIALTELVLSQLRNGVARNSGLATVDVLFHVNTFTATHLEEWIDELNAVTLLQTGKLPIFAVLDSYLRVSDPFVDLSVLANPAR